MTLIAKDFFGTPIQVGDKVAALGVRYQELYLFEVLSISPQKVKLVMESKAPLCESGVCHKFHHQCVVKPQSGQIDHGKAHESPDQNPQSSA